jgi:hypothetical protein
MPGSARCWGAKEEQCQQGQGGCHCHFPPVRRDYRLRTKAIPATLICSWLLPTPRLGAHSGSLAAAIGRVKVTTVPRPRATSSHLSGQRCRHVAAIAASRTPPWPTPGWDVGIDVFPEGEELVTCANSSFPSRAYQQVMDDQVPGRGFDVRRCFARLRRTKTPGGGKPRVRRSESVCVRSQTRPKTLSQLGRTAGKTTFRLLMPG